MSESVIKIGVFYDGNYLYHVSNFYVFHHRNHMRLSISGLHEFMRQEIAEREHTKPEFCRIVDAHYFRGRYTTPVVEQKGWLRGERIFEDVGEFAAGVPQFDDITMVVLTIQGQGSDAQ